MFLALGVVKEFVGRFFVKRLICEFRLWKPFIAGSQRFLTLVFVVHDRVFTMKEHRIKVGTGITASVIRKKAPMHAKSDASPPNSILVVFVIY